MVITWLSSTEQASKWQQLEEKDGIRRDTRAKGGRQTGNQRCFLIYGQEEHYDSLLLTRRLDESGKPIEDHPELPAEHDTKKFSRQIQGCQWK